jgi:hypothetical protein
MFKVDGKSEKKFLITIGDEESKMLKGGDTFETDPI